MIQIYGAEHLSVHIQNNDFDPGKSNFKEQIFYKVYKKEKLLYIKNTDIFQQSRQNWNEINIKLKLLNKNINQVSFYQMTKILFNIYAFQFLKHTKYSA